MSPKTREPDDRREAILEAAYMLFSDKGLECTRLEDVARIARVSKGSLYAVSNNKLDLFYLVCRRQYARDLDQLDALLATIDDPAEVFRNMIVSMLPPEREAPGSYAIIFELAGLALRDKDLGVKVRNLRIEVRDRFRGQIKRVLRAGIEQGLFNPDLDQPLLASIVHGWLDKMWLDWIIIPTITREEVLDMGRRFSDTTLRWVAKD